MALCGGDCRLMESCPECRHEGGVVVPEFVQPGTVFTQFLEEGLGSIFPDSFLPCSGGGLGGAGAPGIPCALA